MPNSVAAMEEISRLFRSHDVRRVRGAYGQMTLWPDEYVELGWKLRDFIRSNVAYFVSPSERVPPSV